VIAAALVALALGQDAPRNLKCLVRVYEFQERVRGPQSVEPPVTRMSEAFVLKNAGDNPDAGTTFQRNGYTVSVAYLRRAGSGDTVVDLSLTSENAPSLGHAELRVPDFDVPTDGFTLIATCGKHKPGAVCPAAELVCK
jgi:hypothetical protein